MKKIASIILMGVLCISLFAGCNTTPTSGTPSASPDSTAEDTSWEYIQNKGEFIVGLDPTFAPMGFTNEKGEIIGYDIDLANMVGEQLGLKVTFQPIDWDSKEMELEGKKVDVLWNGMSKTPERVEKMTLTEPYLNNVIVIMTKKGSDIDTKEDLVGKNLAVQAESSGLEVVENDPIYDQIKDKLTEYKSYDDAIMDLEIGRVDAIIIDQVLGKYKAAQKPDTYEFGTEHFGEDLYVIGLRKSDKAFAEKLQGAMDELIASGKASEASMKWFGEDLVVK